MVQPLTVRVALTGSLTFFKGINETFFGNGVMLGRQRPFQGGGGGPMLPVLILKRLVSVFINACRSLFALPSLSQFRRRRLSLVAISFYALSLLSGPRRLSEFTLAGPHDILLTGQLVFAFNKLEDLWPHMANISVAKATTMSTISMFLTLYYKQTIGITDDVKYVQLIFLRQA